MADDLQNVPLDDTVNDDALVDDSLTDDDSDVDETAGDVLDVTDEDDMLLDVPVADIAIDDPLVEAEREAMTDDEFSEPEGLTGKHADSGWVDEEAWEAQGVKHGAGDEHEEEDLAELGYHIQDLSTMSSSDDTLTGLDDDDAI